MFIENKLLISTIINKIINIINIHGRCRGFHSLNHEPTSRRVVIQTSIFLLRSICIADIYVVDDIKKLYVSLDSGLSLDPGSECRDTSVDGGRLGAASSSSPGGNSSYLPVISNFTTEGATGISLELRASRLLPDIFCTQ